MAKMMLYFYAPSAESPLKHLADQRVTIIDRHEASQTSMVRFTGGRSAGLEVIVGMDEIVSREAQD